jgi:hypothetical protein
MCWLNQDYIVAGSFVVKVMNMGCSKAGNIFTGLMTNSQEVLCFVVLVMMFLDYCSEITISFN